MAKEVKTKEVKCNKCSYIWKTKSLFYYVTCPKCYYKVKLDTFPRKSNKVEVEVKK